MFNKKFNAIAKFNMEVKNHKFIKNNKYIGVDLGVYLGIYDSDNKLITMQPHICVKYFDIDLK